MKQDEKIVEDVMNKLLDKISPEGVIKTITKVVDSFYKPDGRKVYKIDFTLVVPDDSYFTINSGGYDALMKISGWMKDYFGYYLWLENLEIIKESEYKKMS